MKKLLVLVLFSISSASVRSQYNIPVSQYDSLLRLLPKAKEDGAKVDLLFTLAWANEYSYTQAVRYYTQALQLARKLNDKQRIWGSLVSIGLFYANKGEPAKSIAMLQEALLYAEDAKQDPSMPLAFIANGYEVQGDLKNAMDYNRRAFLIYEKRIKDKLPVDERGYSAGPMRMGELFEKMGQVDSALFYAQLGYKRILKKPLEGEEAYFYIGICNVIGTVYSRQNKPAEAIRFFQLALNKAIELKSAANIQKSQTALAKFFYKTNQPDSTIHYALQAYAGATKMRGFEVMKESAFLLRSVYEQQGLFARALYYNDLAIAARDSVSGAEKVREVQNLTFKEEQRQQKIRQTIEEERIAYQTRIKIYSLLAVLGGLLLLAVILYRNNRQKHKANALLHEQKEEIQTQKIQLQSSLETLKSTQNQLIQREKMASLGELTAGIAHEIQNPLNFVNNFSEVSTELVEELKSPLTPEGGIRPGEKMDMQLFDDLTQNLQKITHHGHRAGNIVKGMLEHSRASPGERQPTDLNELADEYLRLAYQGLRAKDKTFNCELITNFDLNIGQIGLVEQDIGRVLLNLVNNAFYAVQQKYKANSGAGNYHPIVEVRTKRMSKQIEIRVLDNGTGIPEFIRAKIFQPFFTTKPTGEGTGLGLSLAYDIVTKGHGGELLVESQENKGTEFIIKLPV